MQDIWIQIIFYVFSAIAVLSALMVITQNNPVRCVLFLVLAFIASSVLWLLVEAEFLALVLVLVYVGAVMTLFLFVVMMLDIDLESIKPQLKRYLPLGLILVASLTGLLLKALPQDKLRTNVEVAIPIGETIEGSSASNNHEQALSNTEALGMVLYTDYVFAFELAAVILLVAIISAITLVHKNRIRTIKRQNVVAQIMTQRNDRIRLVNLISEE
ncbi:MAG: NADH-quinone oxidoreductase subunit J [Legionella sp.]